MKKLTAGIFATLLAVVSADGAYAAIASSGYVDDKVGEVSQTVTTLSGTVSGHTTQIGTINTNLEKKADKATTLSGYGITDAYTSAKGTALEGRVSAVEEPKAQVAAGVTGPVSGGTVYTAIQGVSGDVSGVTSDVGTLKTDMAQAKEDISALETASANHVVKNESITGGTHTKITYDAKGLVTAGANLTAEDIPEIPNTKVSGLGSLATKSNVATADIASKAVTKEKLADEIVTSLGKADSALQQGDLDDYVTETEANAAYAVKTLEGQVGVVSAENMGTTATTVVTAIKEVAGEAADAATAAAGAQSAVDAVESTIAGYGDIVSHNASEFATTGALTSGLAGKLDSDATAARATADAAGNVITTTYATKTEIADMATDENLKLKQDQTDNNLATTNKTVVGAINEVKTTADDASTAAAAAQADATQALEDAATAQSTAEAAQRTADTKQDKLTGTIGGSMQPVYLNNGTITAGTALGTLATKSTVTNAEVADGALSQSKINGLATSLAAKLTTPPATQKGEDGLYVLTYDGTDFKWEDIARTVAE